MDILEEQLNTAELLLKASDDLEEADRRCGELGRKLEYCQDELSRSKYSRLKMKEEAGYTDNASFDVVWNETLQKAKKHDELLELLKLGIRVREAQKHYFKTRTQEALVTSKALEKEFDEKARAVVAKVGHTT